MMHLPVRTSPLGQTRSRVAADHALLAADSQIWTPLAGGHRAETAVHISPEVGARFVMQSIRLAPDAWIGPAAPGVERFLMVLDGEIELTADDQLRDLECDDYAFLPADGESQVTSAEGARLIAFDKVYEPWDDEPLQTLVAPLEDTPAEAYDGDEAIGLQKLLPEDQRFDMAVNLLSLQPGAAWPQVEMHVMEHGLLMLAGAAVFRLGDSWYPVEARDAVWMASYCPQWFVAMGKSPMRCLCYQDVNRDPLASA